MLKIDSEFDRVKNISMKNEKNFLISHGYKDDRDVYILGSFVELMKMGSQVFPEYFIKFKPPEPDFHTYVSDKKFYKQIEIVENMHWGRKRGKEDEVSFDRSKYSEASKRCQIRIWYSFIKNLNDKFLKFYGKDSWLVIYHNINVFHISDIGFWINIIFGIKEEIEKRGLVDFSKSTYEKIFVLNSGFTELVQIFPDNRVIFSKYAQYLLK
ncbi:MAG: hypothetical protein M0P61_12635 [Ignavibacteriaceae bacterium]|jgi:hypothetical protein|nr:hypothetical protein [Ignavibacteriaceae bacterium]